MCVNIIIKNNYKDNVTLSYLMRAEYLLFLDFIDRLKASELHLSY